ncbi:MAG TPA: alpha/beta hydrolase [Candidatus Melainabacteria bacterium]|nr:alpha/beta hydrolase [Candidatus Melainabacteria bacterium]
MRFPSFVSLSFLSVFALSIFSIGVAQAESWQPSEGRKQIKLWPKSAPNPIPPKGPETLSTVTDKLVAGKPWVYVTNVAEPVYSPKGKNTGAAVLVFPGGGYQILAMDLEGTEVCDWLNSKGITAILLKYRVPNKGSYPKSPVALQDAQRAMGLIRARAAEWNIDPDKVGVLGFSAGGHLVAAISTHFDKRIYSPVDAADRQSCRPNFAVALYPGHLWIDRKRFVLNAAVPVTSKTPPTFLLQAEDDKVDPPEHSLVYYRALKRAGVPVEMHLYAKGGHAFGLRPSKNPITKWPSLVETWMESIGML